MKRFRLAYFLAFLLSLPLIAGAAEPQAKKERRVEHIHWNPVTCQLSWVVSEGNKDEKGEYVPDGALISYTINLDNATMGHKNASRRFSMDEAQQVHAVLNALKSYAEQSTDWWLAGKGEKLDKLARAINPPVLPPSE